MRIFVGLIFAGALLSVAFGCSETTPAAGPVPGIEAADASSGGEASSDAGLAGDETAPTPAKTTSVEALIGGVARTLARAQFGRSKADAGETLYIEAHEGGDPECPTETTPTPKRTVIVSGVPLGPVGAVYTKDDGVAVALLDFTGDQLGSKPLTKATAATVTIVAIDAQASVEILLDATFAEGTAAGPIYATYCQSLSD